MNPEPSPLPLPLAFLPGASGRGSVLRPIAERLARRRSPILVDYPGLGDPPADPSIRSVPDLAHAVLEMLPPQVDLVALSLGGAVALWMATRHPERIRRLVLVTTAGGIDVRRLGGVDFRPAFRAARPDAPTFLLEDQTDVTAALRSVTIPTLLVFGERDLVAPPAVGAFLRDLLPAARLQVIPGATHDLEQEEPDLLSSLIEAHLRG